MNLILHNLGIFLKQLGNPLHINPQQARQRSILTGQPFHWFLKSRGNIALINNMLCPMVLSAGNNDK